MKIIKPTTKSSWPMRLLATVERCAQFASNTAVKVVLPKRHLFQKARVVRWERRVPQFRMRYVLDGEATRHENRIWPGFNRRDGRVAVKFYQDEHMFAREVRNLSRLLTHGPHPMLPTLLDAG